jgi:hypothetical protein
LIAPVLLRVPVFSAPKALHPRCGLGPSTLAMIFFFSLSSLKKVLFYVYCQRALKHNSHWEASGEGKTNPIEQTIDLFFAETMVDQLDETDTREAFEERLGELALLSIGAMELGEIESLDRHFRV